MSAHRSSQPSAVGEQRSTLRVRNSDTGVVYHLVFGGNIRKLTGEQLKRHLEGICLIPAEQQQLTFNGTPIGNTSPSDALGLHDKALLELHTARNHGHIPSSNSVFSNNRVGQKSISRVNPAGEHLNISGGGEPLRGVNHTTSGWTRSPTPEVVQHQPQAYDNQGRSVTSKRGVLFHPSHNLRTLVPRDEIPPCSRDPVEAAIEEDNIGDLDAAMTPLHEADVEDARLEQMEYLWMMEQMRFETERMNRERELLRHRQELEYEAEILERERVIVGRRTLQEKRKLAELQQWIREEMTMEARLLRIHDDGGGGDDDDLYVAVGDGGDGRCTMSI